MYQDTTTTVLRGRNSEIAITPGSRTYTIGERCNALAYSSVKKALEERRYDFIVERAVEQERAGADIINVSTVGADVPEEYSLPEAVKQIAQAVSIPISVDFNSLGALESALKLAPERTLVNSVSGERKKREQVFELAKEYNCALIAMPCNDEGVPATAVSRVAIARELINTADKFGIPKDDLIFDAICLAVGADQNAGLLTFETCRLLRSELGVNITIGASNVSFGLPNRRVLDSTYLALAIASGMNVPLTDITIPSIKWAIRSADCCLGQDSYALRYISEYRRENPTKAS